MLLLLLFLLLILFIYLWLCWVFISVRGLSLVVASGDHSSSRCAGPSLSRPLLLRSTGSRRAGSAIVAHGSSRSAACGILPDQGSNPCPLHWQADSQPLRHQGSPKFFIFIQQSTEICPWMFFSVKKISTCIYENVNGFIPEWKFDQILGSLFHKLFLYLQTFLHCLPVLFLLSRNLSST